MALVLLTTIGGIRDANQIRMHGGNPFTIITRQLIPGIVHRSLR
jgi:hypothetical protein